MEKKIFTTPYYQFDQLALEIFRFQVQHNSVYQKYVQILGINPENINTIETIPFLPIHFFKTHSIQTTGFQPEVIFESSGTTGSQTSRHLVRRAALYEESFLQAFRQFYGDPANMSILGLLPNYLERSNSSLVYMTDRLIRESKQPNSGFYLHDLDALYKTLVHNELMQIPTLLLGVTFALLDFAEQYPIKLSHTTIMETGGMKGRREEITRDEVHGLLQDRLGVTDVHSEYGMTELLSQAYASSSGMFHTPGWMKILIREYNDPFAIVASGATTKPATGLINVIDLANLYSCSFIATDDVGKLYKNGRFEVLGRRDSSDLRGCSMLTHG